jgi:predicted aspartyl protease
MGEVVEKITLVNTRDAAYAKGGFIKEADVRKVTVDAVVDTGSGPLVITEAMRQRLGLEIEQNTSVNLAGGVPQKCAKAELVDIHWEDRYTSSRPIVLPQGDETLLGVIPLEDMDLLVNPVDRCLQGVHGTKWLHQVRSARLRCCSKKI